MGLDKTIGSLGLVLVNLLHFRLVRMAQHHSRDAPLDQHEHNRNASVGPDDFLPRITMMMTAKLAVAVQVRSCQLTYCKESEKGTKFCKNQICFYVVLLPALGRDPPLTKVGEKGEKVAQTPYTKIRESKVAVLSSVSREVGVSGSHDEEC